MGCRFSSGLLLPFGKQGEPRPSLLVRGRHASVKYILNIKQQWFLSAHLAGFLVMPDPGPHQERDYPTRVVRVEAVLRFQQFRWLDPELWLAKPFLHLAASVPSSCKRKP